MHRILQQFEIFTVREHFQFARDWGGIFELSGWQLFSESTSILMNDNKAHLNKNSNNYKVTIISLVSLIHTASVKKGFSLSLMKLSHHLAATLKTSWFYISSMLFVTPWTRSINPHNSSSLHLPLTVNSQFNMSLVPLNSDKENDFIFQLFQN